MRTKITKYEFAWNSTDRRLYIDSEDDYIGNWSVKECSSSQERIGDTNKDNYATDIVITGDAGITYGA